MHHCAPVVRAGAGQRPLAIKAAMALREAVLWAGTGRRDQAATAATGKRDLVSRVKQGAPVSRAAVSKRRMTPRIVPGAENENARKRSLYYPPGANWST